MQPFRGIFPPLEGEQGSVFDVSMLFAIFMYGLLALGLHALIAWIDRKISSLRYESMWQPAAAPAIQADGRDDPGCSAGPATRGVRGHVAATGSTCSFSEAPPSERR